MLIMHIVFTHLDKIRNNKMWLCLTHYLKPLDGLHALSKVGVSHLSAHLLYRLLTCLIVTRRGWCCVAVIGTRIAVAVTRCRRWRAAVRGERPGRHQTRVRAVQVVGPGRT
jgi:hypothetical protein